MDIETIIMIVEDDEILANEIRSFLLRWGYCAKICTDFQNITGAFLNWNPHLVLMDINLPYYDGFYWCRMIREISAAVMTVTRLWQLPRAAMITWKNHSI